MMRNDDRATDNQADREAREERAGLASAGTERKEPVDDGPPIIDSLDAQTRAEVDEVLERSILLARDIIAAFSGR